MEGKELLKKLGEETLYSAKGHFKAGDIRRSLVTFTIWGCAILNIISLLDLGSNVLKAISVAGLLGLIALLLWNEGEGKDYRGRHKQIAESYLALHKEIRSCFFLTDCNNVDIEKLSKKIIEFDKSNKPDIPWIARIWAKKAIEKYGETDNWFLK